MGKFNLFGTDLFGNPAKISKQGIIHNRYKIPPFSVLNTSDKFWMSRKRRWLDLGIKSELGRGAKTYNTTEWVKEKGINENASNFTGTSIFDPVLCELMYSWFCPIHGQIIDPFAGGSVRGIVASLLDYTYWGCDLSRKQIKANRKNAIEIFNKKVPTKLNWVTGDCLYKLDNAPKADFLFTCPPYGNLEKYSDDPLDLSSYGYDEFLLIYEKVIRKSIKKVKNNRFACFVVGDFRNNKGVYNPLVKDTISIFQKYNMFL